MKSAFFNPQQKQKFSNNPILVIDRLGIIGKPLVLKLSQENQVVFVSNDKMELNYGNQSIIYISFSKKIPSIPDYKYSDIIFVDEEGLDLELLPEIIKKAKNINADFIFAQGLFSKNEGAIAKIQKTYNTAQIALFGDIFGRILIPENINLNSVVNRYIYQAQRFGRIQVLGNGLRESYPVFLDDVVEKLAELVLGSFKQHSIFYIFPKHPPSELSLAHMIQKSNPEITVDFIRHDSRVGNVSYPPGGIYLLGEKYSLAQKIRGIDVGKKVNTQTVNLLRNNNRGTDLPLFIFWILIFLLFSPMVLTLLFAFLGNNIFNYASRELSEGNLIQAKKSLHLSELFYYFENKASGVFSFQAKAVGGGAYVDSILENIDVKNTISNTLFQALNSVEYFSKIMKGTSNNSKADLSKGIVDLKGSIIELNKMASEKKVSVSIAQELEKIKPLINFFLNTSDILPNILGMEGKRAYLVLLQNSQELRPGGGVIEAYGILKFNLGKITEFSIHDTSDADSQLRGHVEPPFGIRRYLPEKNWYLKDSNFDVNFVNSATTSSNFIFVETGEKIDGVLGMDTAFIKNILQVIGPVHVNKYAETVSEINIYKLIQFHAQDNNYLKLICEAILAKTKNEKPNYVLLAQIVSDAIIQKNLLLTFKPSQNIFTVNGWSSSLWDDRKGDGKSINDFVGIIEANLGSNKINYFISREVSQKIVIDDSQNVSEEVSINFKNESPDLKNGEYKNFLRMILPNSAKLSEIDIDDKPQTIVDAITDPLTYESKKIKTPKGLEVEKIIENNKTIFSFMINIPAGKTTKVKLKYSLVENIQGQNSFSYNLRLFKQPGIDSFPYSFFLTYPDTFNVVKGSDGLTEGKGIISYSKIILQDGNLIINFSKK